MRSSRSSTLKIVGHSPSRVEGLDKVTGRARYVDDISVEGMLFGRTIRSPVARGKLRSTRFVGDPSGFTIVDHGDIPGRNVVAAIVDDQPCLVESAIEHAEEPILLLAHADREALLRAHVELEIESTTPEFDPLRSQTVFKHVRIEKGDVEAALAKAPHVIEGEYRTGAQEQLYIETNGMIAIPEDGGITVIGSLQCPYYVHTALVRLLGLAPEKVRVVQAETGGGFGGKEEYPSILAGHSALLALKAKRPVKLIYDRLEDMVATTKRHPSIVRHRTGVAKDGTILAMDIEVILDGGAYTTLSPVVLSRGCIHATGAYRCPSVRIAGRAVKTNTPPNGAFRGFGAPQTQFAIEVHIDRIAHQLGLDPIAIRRKNVLRPGDTTATGQVMGRDCSAKQALETAVKTIPPRRKSAARTDLGIGVALFFHGSGFTGSGEQKLKSRASLELTPSGVTVHAGSTEIGQGTRTMLAQIVAEELGWPLSRVTVSKIDTRIVPDSGPTVASRTCLIVGGILRRCARALRLRLAGTTARAYLAEHGSLVITEQYEKPKEIVWDDETYRGSAYAAYAFGCNVATVRIERETGIVTPLELIAVLDIGKAVNPVLARGQIEGGTLQGVGWALLEEVRLENGRMKNGQLTNYLIPTMLDSPRIEVAILEHPSKLAPFGAKGVGEAPIDGPAPAIVNAIRSLGYDIRTIPATPERILEVACDSD